MRNIVGEVIINKTYRLPVMWDSEEETVWIKFLVKLWMQVGKNIKSSNMAVTFAQNYCDLKFDD